MHSSRSGTIAAALLALVVVGTLVANACLYTVDEREQAVILEFGKPVASRTVPGLYTKIPFVQEVRRLPKTLRFWRSGTDSPLKDLPTADGKKIEVSAWAVWRITDPEAFVRSLRTVEGGENAVMVRVRAAVRDVITAHALEEVVRSSGRKLTYSFQNVLADPSELPDVPVAVAPPGVSGRVVIGREAIMKLVGEKVTAQLQQERGADAVERGIELVEVGLSNIEFVPIVREAAFERQRAFMLSIAAAYSNAGVQRKQEILNATNAEVEKILGEGEQQSRIIRGDADATNIAKYADAIKETGDFFDFVRTLEVYEKSLTGETRLILTTNSDLLRLLKGTDLPETTPSQSDTTAAAE